MDQPPTPPRLPPSFAKPVTWGHVHGANGSGRVPHSAFFGAVRPCGYSALHTTVCTAETGLAQPTS